MSTAKLPNLARTEAAIAAYDEKWGDDYDVYQEDDLAIGVGEAFGLDTIDRNDPAVCKALIRPGPREPRPGYRESFVRRMVRNWNESTK